MPHGECGVKRMKWIIRGLIIPVFLILAGCAGEAVVLNEVRVGVSETGAPTGADNADQTRAEAGTVPGEGPAGTAASVDTAVSETVRAVDGNGAGPAGTGTGTGFDTGDETQIVTEAAVKAGTGTGTETKTGEGAVTGTENGAEAETGGGAGTMAGGTETGPAGAAEEGQDAAAGTGNTGNAAESPAKTAGAGAERPAGRHVRIPVLLYHHFMKDNVPEERYSTTVTEAQFEDHVRTLSEKGYNTISLEDLRAYIEEGRALPPNPYMITADDGYDSNYYIMYPILKKYNAKAVIFATGSMITDEPGRRWNENSLVWMTWDMLREMEESGLVEIQNHGYIHRPADTMSPEEFSESVAMGEKLLDEKLGERKIKAFAYPHGKATEATRKFLKDNGYKMQFMVRAGLIRKDTDMADLPRIIVSHGKTGQDILNMIKKYE